MYELAIILVFPALVVFAAAMDFFSMTIPNKVSILLVAGFFCLAPFSPLTMSGIGLHVAAGLMVLAITIGLFAFGVIGGGDAKLAAAVSLWLGFGHLIDYTIWTAILGGALSIALLAFRKMPLPASWIGLEWVQRLHAPKGGIPYGIALAAAALVVYQESFWYRAILG
ncbi:MAG: prepilin peptidase [Hyphomicrobiaceae bacterium]|nr:peptidase [Hyphomicrobiaceae bacterium]